MGGRILIFEWNAFMQDSLMRSMKRLGLEYDTFLYYLPRDSWDEDEVFEDKFIEKLESGAYDTVFSMNFCPVVSDVCQKRGIHYISWVYDSPIHIKRTDSLKNACNDIYFFDRQESEERRESGVTGAHHLALAVEPEKFSDDGIELIKASRAAEGVEVNTRPAEWYECDVAMVGQLYHSQYAYICSPLNEYYRGYLEGIVRAQQNIMGGYILSEMCDDALIDRLNELIIPISQDGSGITANHLIYAMGTEITGRDRYTILALLQNRCKVNLYSGDTDERLENVNFKGYIDYDTQMPLAFRGAKINLNISLRTIQTGIPLRVLDILGSGGFLITNMQPEIMENFVDGRDLVIYEDYVDLVRKVEYYLIHEEERAAIARNGYERVKELFSFDDRARTLFADKLSGR